MDKSIARLTSQQLSIQDDDEERDDTDFECPPPTAQALADIYGYDLSLCGAFLSSCLDLSDPIEPTEEGLHTFAASYLQAQRQDREDQLDRLSEDRYEDRW